MPEEPSPAEPPSSDPSTHGSWAPLDPRAAAADPWVPAAPTYSLTADAEPPVVGPTTGPAHPPAGERRTRRLATGLVLVVALLLCGGVGLGGYALLRPGDQPQAAPPADDPWHEGDDAAGASTAAPEPPTPSTRPATTPSTGPGRSSVVYEVTGQGRADILYYDANGERVWLEAARLPWRASIRTDRQDRVMVQASRTKDSGERPIACSVTVDGGEPLTEETTSTGWRASCFR
ncbi:MmpS family transport accessory protein [Micromonospora sp. NPDC048909]|uniref:MmpS family transport accessory protein n=1 Tax=Micromonospora sp. NPDC048909 TaxID=3155643 RepID=UPI0033F167A3